MVGRTLFSAMYPAQPADTHGPAETHCRRHSVLISVIVSGNCATYYRAFEATFARVLARPRGRVSLLFLEEQGSHDVRNGEETFDRSGRPQSKWDPSAWPFERRLDILRCANTFVHSSTYYTRSCHSKDDNNCIQKVIYPMTSRL